METTISNVMGRLIIILIIISIGCNNVEDPKGDDNKVSPQLLNVEFNPAVIDSIDLILFKMKSEFKDTIKVINNVSFTFPKNSTEKSRYIYIPDIDYSHDVEIILHKNDFRESHKFSNVKIKRINNLNFDYFKIDEYIYNGVLYKNSRSFKLISALDSNVR